ncbi:MAG: helix-turn-helix domain-containing protein [Candidatus Arsenophonus phytopathogenicus]
MNDEIAKRLKLLRERANLSQRELANLCGWASQSRIGNYESAIRSISAEDAAVIGEALGVEPAFLLFGTKDDTIPPPTLTQRQRILLELFEELPSQEADEFLKTLENKKRYYNQLVDELVTKKKRKFSL